MCTRTPTAVVVQHNTRMHLTNYAINKGSKNFVPPGGTARAGGRPPPPPPAHTADTPSRTSREDGARVVAAAQDDGPTEGAVSVYKYMYLRRNEKGGCRHKERGRGGGSSTTFP